jgi:hypothetical protein
MKPSVIIPLPIDYSHISGCLNWYVNFLCPHVHISFNKGVECEMSFFCIMQIALHSVTICLARSDVSFCLVLMF